MPRSLENYVQEIGRAGRDGKLARCHMFLHDKDYYQLRSISLSDLLDSQNAIMLTSRIILEAKKEYVRDSLGLAPTKKRRLQDSDEGRVVF